MNHAGYTKDESPRGDAEGLKGDDWMCWPETGQVANEFAEGQPLATLRCRSCGWIAAMTKAELVSHGAGAWPRCCGEVMSLEFPMKIDEW